MKKLIYLIIFILPLLAFNSCKSTLPGRFEHFVSKVEKNANNYSDNDWDTVKSKYEDLFDEYKSYKKDLSPKDRERIERAKSKYNKILFSHKVDDMLGHLKHLLTDTIDNTRDLMSSSPLPKCFEFYVSQISKHYKTFDRDEWAMANDGFEMLIKKYNDKKDSLSSSEKERIRKAIAKYYSLLSIGGTKESIKAFFDMLSNIPEMAADLLNNKDKTKPKADTTNRSPITVTFE